MHESLSIDDGVGGHDKRKRGVIFRVLDPGRHQHLNAGR